MLKMNPKSDGVSLRTIHFWLVVGAVIACSLMFLFTFHLTDSFQKLTQVSEQQIELRNAASQLIEASDYLTERAQRFTVEGDTRFLEEYFEEAFEANRREEAVARMKGGKGSLAAQEKLQDAMRSSLLLMQREYYAMKLVIEAKGYTEYPEILRSVHLSEEDAALSAHDKMHLATQMVLDDAYYEMKDQVRSSMKESLAELERITHDTDHSALASLQDEMVGVRVVIVLQAIGIFFMVWLTSRLGIHPVLAAVDRIKADSPIPVVGANEFRYLARTYNTMYEVYKSSLEHLNFKASHDELTGAYNRSGYELLLSSINMDNTYMLLFDVDNFKRVNDGFGHETGDRVLVKLVNVLRSNFRSDDYICRIGGDEFVVFMVHSTELQRNLIVQKITLINRALADTADGLPATSVSVGIVHGTQVASAEELFEKTDAAMYKAKQQGKSTYQFG